MGMRERPGACAASSSAGPPGDPRRRSAPRAVQVVATLTLGAIFGSGGLGRYPRRGHRPARRRHDLRRRRARRRARAGRRGRLRPPPPSDPTRRVSREWKLVSAAGVGRGRLAAAKVTGLPALIWLRDRRTDRRAFAGGEGPMRVFRKLALGASVLALALSACSTGGGGATIKIGSDGFDEARIVAEIYAQALEAKGFTVDRAGIGARRAGRHRGRARERPDRPQARVPRRRARVLQGRRRAGAPRTTRTRSRTSSPPSAAGSPSSSPRPARTRTRSSSARRRRSSSTSSR